MANIKIKQNHIVLANPRGFCAGVERAISIVNQVLIKHGPPIYVKHEIVHNDTIVNDFKRRGVQFIENPDTVPVGAVLIYSAHGVSKATRQASEKRNLTIYDATCPLVTKVHAEVGRLHKIGFEIIMIGHANHPEVEGTLGQLKDNIYLVENKNDIAALKVKNEDKIAYVTQTTLSVDDTSELIKHLKKRFPSIVNLEKSDICYATQNRQDAVKKMASRCDVVLVVGSVTSSNSTRLCEVAKQQGATAYLVDSYKDIQTSWLAKSKSIGVTAGASAPEHLVRELVQWLQSHWQSCKIEEALGNEENIVFSIPKSLLNASPPHAL